MPSASSVGTAELIALMQATGDDGLVDLTAFEAQRLILVHQSIDGLDAPALVNELTQSPAYADPRGREQIGPLLDAIKARLPETDARRFSEALDTANVGESWLERQFERRVQEPLEAGFASAKRWANDGLAWTDQQISDNLAAAKKWADGIRTAPAPGPAPGVVERDGSPLAAEFAGKVQEGYGIAKGAGAQALKAVGETVDLAKLAYRFSCDKDFRNLMIGAAGIYASDVVHDPAKPLTDIQKAAGKAWNEWQEGLAQAARDGKEREYLGEAKGALGLQLIASVVPVSKLTQLAKIARGLDAAGDIAPVAGRAAGRVGGYVEREAASELTHGVVELVLDAQRMRERGGFGAAAADRMFDGLAGVKRS
jgi:hypothetical protein